MYVWNLKPKWIPSWFKYIRCISILIQTIIFPGKRACIVFNVVINIWNLVQSNNKNQVKNAKIKEHLIFTWKPSREKPRVVICATHDQWNLLYEKEFTPSSDSRTLTLDNLRLWTLPLATLGLIPSDIPWYTTLGVSNS